MKDERTRADVPSEPGPEPDYRHLPPRVTPDQMVETQAVDHPDSAVHSDTDTEWMIRTSGAG